MWGYKLKIYLVNDIEEVDDDSLAILQRLLKSEKLEKVNKYHNKADKQRCVVGEVLIRFILSEACLINCNEVSFTYNEYGKPYIINQSGIEFNLSHSCNYAAGAIDTMPIGIDIERIKEIDLSIAKYFFSSQEYSDLISFDQFTQLNYFYDLWTLKESYIKAKGKGLSIPLNSFTIRKVKEIIYMENNEEFYYFKQYFIEKDYTLSVCARNNNFPSCVNVIKLEDLVHYAKMMRSFHN